MLRREKSTVEETTSSPRDLTFSMSSNLDITTYIGWKPWYIKTSRQREYRSVWRAHWFLHYFHLPCSPDILENFSDWARNVFRYFNPHKWHVVTSLLLQLPASEKHQFSNRVGRWWAAVKLKAAATICSHYLDGHWSPLLHTLRDMYIVSSRSQTLWTYAK